MTNTTYRLDIINKLSKIMSFNEAQSEIDFLLREEFNLDKKDLLLFPEKILKFQNKINEIVEIRLNTRKPLQYIINKATFYNEVYYVDENVLIPRPETELLVNEVIKRASSESKILDIGTGSGCIPITLAKELNNHNITSCDISEKALDIAKVNAEKICHEIKIDFILSDLFQNIKEQFDVIVSNPPYISHDLKQSMQPEVLDFEPHSALFAENEGMLFYEKIIKSAQKFLNKNGLIAFEVGIDQAEKVKHLLEKENFKKVVIISDFTPIDRLVLAYYNN